MSDGFAKTLDELGAQGRLRQLTPLNHRQGCRIDRNGQTLLNLSSNDYLGVAGDQALLAKFYSFIDEGRIQDEFALGSASSRLLSGDNAIAHRLEAGLADAYEKEGCLLFNSGYHANIGILPALFGKGDLIVSDKLNHASIVDGLRLSAAQHRRYRHLDYDQLESMLERERGQYRHVVIVSESVFSMDGDVADLPRLIALKKRHQCFLYLDEAHSIGLYGNNGLGQAQAQAVLGEVDFLVGTFGKAWGSIGAFVLCSRIFKEYLVNHSRSLIFTTALPPVILSWNLFILNQLESFESRRTTLARLSAKLRDLLHQLGLSPMGTTNIIPIMLGEAELAVRLARAMQDMGYLILPIRPPTVPQGTSRFRLSVTADMDEIELSEMASRLVELLASVKRAP